MSGKDQSFAPVPHPVITVHPNRLQHPSARAQYHKECFLPRELVRNYPRFQSTPVTEHSGSHIHTMVNHTENDPVPLSSLIPFHLRLFEIESLIEPGAYGISWAGWAPGSLSSPPLYPSADVTDACCWVSELRSACLYGRHSTLSSPHL